MAVQDSEGLRQWLWLTQSEKVVRKAIQESDTPFLGLLGEAFTKEMLEAMVKAIAANPTVSGYVSRFESYPALFAVNLAWHVMHGMGQGGYFSLYPHVQKALGMRQEPTQTEREPLWQAFRRSLLLLGLEPSPRTSGSHFMANEYLRQAGVPLPFMDALAARMLAFANKVGLPEEDDPEGIVSWQAGLDARLELPFSQTARKALALDRQGYYTRGFLRVHEAGGQSVDANNVLEKAMAAAFQGSGPSTFRRAALPRVVLHDGCLGVFFPSGEGQKWSLEVDGTVRLYDNTGAEDNFIPISQVLPGELKVSGLSNGQKMQVTLWEDEKLNRLLFFSDTGRLFGRGQLAQNEPLTLPPGGYTVLARFTPGGVETETISDEPRLVSFPLSLGPGETRVFSNGPARLEVRAECIPLIRWLGDAHTSKEGVEFQYGVVNLDVELPTDWLGKGASYELKLVPGERGAPQVVPLELDADGKGMISVSDLAAKAGWKPGLMRLVVELRRSGEARILLRTATLFWLGLREISRGLRFRCADWPENLKLEFGENLERDGNDLVVKDAAARGVRLVFALSDTRQQSLTWNVPGVFVEVETVADGGVCSRARRALGSTETVSLTSAKQIVVIASDLGTLRLGEWSQLVDFSRHSTRLLSAAFLASRLTPQSHTLVYQNEVTGISLDLLLLTQPHEVSGFASQTQGGQFVIRLHVSEPMDAIAVRALALLSNDDDLFTLQANASEWSSTRFGQARLMMLDGNQGGYAAEVYVNLDYWPAGAWLFNLDAQIKGIWGHLQNSRQDVFAAGLLWAEGGHALSSRVWLEQLGALEDRQACDLLKRIHIALQICYAQEAWNGIAWLGEAWKALAKRWRGKEAEALPALVDMAAMRPPEDSSPSWLPQLSIAAALPGLFALAAEKYRRVNEKPRSIARALRAMGEMAAHWPAVFPDLLHFSAAAACVNFPAISARGESPQGVDPKRYVEAMHAVPEVEYIYQLGDDDALPGPGTYLGPLHYRHAWRALETAYEQTLLGNDIWRGQGIGLAQYAHRAMPTLEGAGVPQAWRGKSPHINAWPSNADALVEDHLLQQRENLNHIAHVLAGLALACRREARVPGALKTYLDQLNQAGIPLDRPLAFLLQIGDALFAYYLLLWELVLKAAQGENHE
ncbi:MAG: hypothetical protein Q8O37_15010 [Sulfuricellaceae bacterium]|nr:hypothetical protein [Sulfuricellaceae bacterium]